MLFHPVHAISPSTCYCTHLGLPDGLLDVDVGLGVGDGVPDADAVALEQQPVVHARLDVAVQLAADLEAEFEEDDVGQRSCRRTQRLLADDARDQYSVFDQHLR